MNRSTTPRYAMMLGASALMLLASSCNFNVFSPIDSPGGDPQVLSAARAALDRGDFARAAELYQQLSNDVADIRLSEQAFTVLAKANVGMAAFASAFGSGENANAGKALTSIANKIGSGAGLETRLALFHALQQGITISSNNIALRGLVRFLTSMALIADMLAEGAANPSLLAATDIALTPATCAPTADTPAACAAAAGCARPTASNLKSGPGTQLDLAATTTTDAMISDVANAPTLSLIQSAVDQVNIALNTEIGASGSLSGAVGGFVTGLGGLAFAGDAPCYRAQLLKLGVGAY